MAAPTRLADAYRQDSARALAVSHNGEPWSTACRSPRHAQRLEAVAATSEPHPQEVRVTVVAGAATVTPDARAA